MNSAKFRNLAISFVLLMLFGSNAAWSQTRAALVRDVDRELSQPVDGTCQAFTLPIAGAFCVLYTVPAGKRLKVEMFSYVVNVSSGNTVNLVLVGKGTGPGNIIIGSQNVHAVTTGQDYLVGTGFRQLSGSTQEAIFLDEGQILIGQMYGSGGASYQQYFTFTGYLVDKN